MKRLATAFLTMMCLLLGVTAQAPAVTAPSDATTQTTLTNGMHVILLPNSLAPVATTIMTYGAGSDDDSLGGTAHATEHMMFRGTTDISAGQFADIAARAGAQYNALTSNEFTLYYFNVPSPYVSIALRLEADRMANAAMKAADWRSERGAIQQEIRAQESNPSYKIGVKLRNTFFGGTPFANASGGTAASLAKMSITDISSFYHKWYRPENATLTVAGDIDAAATLAQIHQLFDRIPRGAPFARAPITVPPLAASKFEESMDFPIGFGALAFRAPGSSDADYAASQILTSALNNPRSALADLTTNGKTLAAFNIANAFPELGASFLLAIPARGTTPQSSQDLLRGVLDQYIKSGVPADLLAASRRQLSSEQLYSRASISGLAFSWAVAQTQGQTPVDLYRALENASDADVNRVLAQYFSPQHETAIVILPKPTTTVAKVDPSAGVENVKYTPKTHESLPAWATVALGQPLRAPSARFAIQRLHNGIATLVDRQTTSPTIILSGIVRQDSQLYEPPGKDGISLLLGALLPWGTTTYDKRQYQAQLDAISADVSLGRTFSLKVEAKDFDRGVQLLADGMLNPSLTPAAFSIVKASTQQNVAVSNKLPATKADLAQRLAMYQPGDPRRRDITERTIANIGLDDIQKYYRFAYRPDETTIAVVGDVTPAQAQAVIRKYFGAWKALGPKPTFRYPVLPRRAQVAKSITVKAATNTQSQVTLRQTFLMRRSDPDYVPLLLANTMLSGEGTSSLLFADLRTHYGYVYSVDSNVSVGHRGGEFSISFASDPKNVGKANAEAIAVIKRLQTSLLPVVELQQAKSLLLASRVLPLDSYSGLAADMLGGASEGYVNTGDDSWFWDALVRTTPAQLRHGIRRINTGNFTRVIIAPGA